MDRNDDRDDRRYILVIPELNTNNLSENCKFCRRQAQGARIIKLAPLEKGELPEWGHLRHIMSELTKLIFYRDENICR
jgi:hypothetical protein